MTGSPAPRRVYLDYTGCRLNEAEIEQMARQFTARGDIVTGDPAGAELVVVNTCAVTNDAARKSRQLILQAARANPAARIAATGCYTQIAPGQVASLPGVAYTIDNLQKDHLVGLVSDDTADYESEPFSREVLPPGTLGRTRAFVKVQDGCDNHCTFCVTTIARGAGRSRPLAEVVDEAVRLSEGGYREIVLTGVHLGSYGHDLGAQSADDPRGLAGLVTAILREAGILRLRLSSLEPWDLSAGFFRLWEDQRLCPHLHLPLQSGCDDTLRRMARRTSQSAFRALVAEARAAIPGLGLTTDVIAGFPGETEQEFDQSLGYIDSIGFNRLHVFSYSPRPGTAAGRMRHQVPGAVASERRARLQALSDRAWARFEQSHIGKTVDVLWESARGATPDGLVWSGLAGNYLRVHTTSQTPLQNTISRVCVTGHTGFGLSARQLTG